MGELIRLDINNLITKGKEIYPPRICVYGVHGIGKSTFGASGINPIFIQTEDGNRRLDISKFPVARSIDDFFKNLEAIEKGKHNFNTLVIDSLDWLEALIFKQICEDNSVQLIADISYGRGYAKSYARVAEVLQKLDDINRNRGMAILLIAHSKISRFENPETQAYDRYTINMREDAAQKIMEWCDALLFCNYITRIKKDGENFGKEEVRGIGQGERVIYTQERPGFFAKNKFNLPFEIKIGNEPESWLPLWQEIYKNY